MSKKLLLLHNYFYIKYHESICNQRLIVVWITLCLVVIRSVCKTES